MKIDTSKFEKYRKDISKHTSELIKIPSISGTKEVIKALNYVETLAMELGFSCLNVEDTALEVNYGNGKEVIGVLFHLDVVPPGDGWSNPPFEGEIKDECIFGRGGTDNKGPAIATLFCLKALKDNGFIPERTIRLIFGTSEETSTKDMEVYFANRPLPIWGFSPDAAYPIINREKGIATIDLERKLDDASVISLEAGRAYNMVPDRAKIIMKLDENVIDNTFKLSANEKDIHCKKTKEGFEVIADGVSAHGAVPEEGINAAYILLSFLEKASILPKNLKWYLELISNDTKGEKLGIALNDDVSGDLSLNMGKMNYENKVVKAGLNVRYPVTYSIEDVKVRLEKKIIDYDINMIIKGNMPPLYVKEDTELIRKLKKSYYDVTKSEAICDSMGGGTYARAMRNRAVAFGAFLEGAKSKGAHMPDEVVYIGDLMNHVAICYRTLIELSIREG